MGASQAYITVILKCLKKYFFSDVSNFSEMDVKLRKMPHSVLSAKRIGETLESRMISKHGAISNDTRAFTMQGFYDTTPYVTRDYEARTKSFICRNYCLQCSRFSQEGVRVKVK